MLEQQEQLIQLACRATLGWLCCGLSLLTEGAAYETTHLCTSDPSHHLLCELVAWGLAIGRLMLLIFTHGEEGGSPCIGRNNVKT